MTGIMTQIIELLVSGITSVATGIGTGLGNLAKAIFLTGAGTEANPYALSVFGSLVVIFAGISLALGLCRLVLHWITSLGASKNM